MLQVCKTLPMPLLEVPLTGTGGALKPTCSGTDDVATGNCVSVRDPTTWTITRHDGPDHLGL